MTSNKDVLGISLKLAKAAKEAQELDALISLFFTSNPYQVACYRHSETDRPTYVVTGVAEAPAEISIGIGSVLHNLRSALDYMAYRLVSLETRSQGPYKKVSFPIYDSENRFVDERNNRIKNIGKNIADIFDALKPYKGGNDWLWYIHELNIIDKHRLLITVGSAFRSMNIAPYILRGNEEMFKKMGFDLTELMMNAELEIKHDTPLFPLSVGNILFEDVPGAPLNTSTPFKFDLSFGEPSDLLGKPLGESIAKMIDEVNKIYVYLLPQLT